MVEATEDRSATCKHFARVRPIVGTLLAEKRVAVLGMPNAGTLIKLLAANGLCTWLVADPGDGSMGKLCDYLEAQHGEALAVDITRVPTKYWFEHMLSWSPDLIIVLDGFASQGSLLSMSKKMPGSQLWIRLPRGENPCMATVVLAGESPGLDLARHADIDDGNTVDYWAWATSAPLCARLARALMLIGTPASHSDLTGIGRAGREHSSMATPATRWLCSTTQVSTPRWRREKGSFVRRPGEITRCWWWDWAVWAASPLSIWLLLRRAW